VNSMGSTSHCCINTGSGLQECCRATLVIHSSMTYRSPRWSVIDFS
jgi:hypothetical protein